MLSVIFLLNGLWVRGWVSLPGGDTGLWAPVGLRTGFAWQGESVVEVAQETAAVKMDGAAVGGKLGRPKAQTNAPCT